MIYLYIYTDVNANVNQSQHAMEARRSLSATPMKNGSKWLICAGNLFHKNAGFVFFFF